MFSIFRRVCFLAVLGSLFCSGCHSGRSSHTGGGAANRVILGPPALPPPPVLPGPEIGDNTPPPLPAGMRAPAFQTKTLRGKSLSLASLRGSVVLLDYWATWCVPCRMATPTLEALHKQFVSKGLRVVGLSVDQPDSVAQVKPFVKAFGMTYLVSAVPAANRRIENAYRVDTLPAQFLIDKKGVVRWSQSGFAPDEGPELAARIRTLLAEKQP